MIDGEKTTIKKNAFISSFGLWSVVSFCNVVVEEEAFAKTQNGTTIYYETGKTVEGNRCVEFAFADGIVHFKGDVKLAKDELFGVMTAMQLRYGQENTVIKAIKFDKFNSNDIIFYDSLELNANVVNELNNSTVYVCIYEEAKNSFKEITISEFVKEHTRIGDFNIRFLAKTSSENDNNSDKPDTFFGKIIAKIKGFMDTITYWVTSLFKAIRDQWANN